MLCCFGGASNVVRCYTYITAQLGVEGAEESSVRPSRRTSTTSLSSLPVAEHGTDEGNPAEFQPPSHFPGLATLVCTQLRSGARARCAELKRLSCAPAAGAAMLVCITLVVDLTFAEKSRLAEEWRTVLAKKGPATQPVETEIMHALVTKRCPGLTTINTVVVSDGGGTKREDSVHRLAGRPSHRRLRTSMNSTDIDAEMAAAPEGTFNMAESPQPTEQQPKV